MSRTHHHGKRGIYVRGIRHAQPDVRKLARALIDLATAQAEAEAEAQHKQQIGKVVQLTKKSVGPQKDAA